MTKTISIVIVDDNVVTREAVADLIRQRPGFDVLVASANPTDAVDKFEKEKLARSCWIHGWTITTVLVDGSSEPDASNNGIGASESHDDLSVPASWVLAVMQHCRLNSTIAAIRGADDLIYSLEKSPNLFVVADSLSASWRQVTSVTFDQSVATYDASKIRTLWRYNLFGNLP